MWVKNFLTATIVILKDRWRKHTKCLDHSCLIGASLSEPHIDEFAVNFPYIYFIYIYRTLCRKSLPARILRVIASFVNSNQGQRHVFTIGGTSQWRSLRTLPKAVHRGV